MKIKNYIPSIAFITSVFFVAILYLKGSKGVVSKSLPDNNEANIDFILNKIYDNSNLQDKMTNILKLRDLSEKFPDNVKIQWNMGLLSMESNQNKKAINRFNKVISLDPNYYDAYFNLSNCYLASGDTMSSIMTLERLINLSSDSMKMRAEKLLNKIN